MSNNVNKPSVRRQAAGLNDRLTALEQNFARVLFNLNSRFQAIDTQNVDLNDYVATLVDEFGREDVEAKVNARRIQRERDAAEKEKAKLEQGVKDGYVVPSETVDDKSIIVGRYLAADGSVQEPERNQMTMPTVAPEFQAKLLNQKVGLTLDMPDGGKYELLEIYTVDTQKYRDFEEAKGKALAEQAEKAVAEASQAAAADEAKDAAESESTEEMPEQE